MLLHPPQKPKPVDCFIVPKSASSSAKLDGGKALCDAALQSAPLHPTLKIKSSHDYYLLKEQFLLQAKLRPGWSRLFLIDQIDATTGKTTTLSFFKDLDDIKKTMS